ncbi:hypothetical protein WG947_12250 [Pontibacter sp. H259]
MSSRGQFLLLQFISYSFIVDDIERTGRDLYLRDYNLEKSDETITVQAN